MRLHSIRLTNYRLHADLQIEFGPGFNVIVGVNGSGKTSVLKGVCDALAGFVDFLPLTTAPYQWLRDENIARLRGDSFNGRYRFEAQFPVVVNASADLEFHEGRCTWAMQKNGQADHPIVSGVAPGHIWNSRQPSEAMSSHSDTGGPAVPIIAFYRANRHWGQTQPHVLQAATAKISRMDGFAYWWDASADAASLQVWVISKCLERFQISSESGTPFDAIESDELALVNMALTAAVEGIHGLKYDLAQKSLLIEWTAGEGATAQPTAFENLSDGQRAVIALVADIARRMCVLNPQLGNKVTLKTPGVVLIDELDVHLHPRWQRIVTSGLKRAFPEVQFIVASHSPQVLGELRPEEIILLRPDGTSHPQVSYGLTSSQVLEEIMGADARAPEVQKLLDEAFEVLERGELQAARERLAVLESKAPDIPELAGAWALLRRKEVIGR